MILELPTAVPSQFSIKSLFKVHDKCSWNFLVQFLRAFCINPYRDSMQIVPGTISAAFSSTSIFKKFIINQWRVLPGSISITNQWKMLPKIPRPLPLYLFNTSLTKVDRNWFSNSFDKFPGIFSFCFSVSVSVSLSLSFFFSLILSLSSCIWKDANPKLVWETLQL